MLNRFSDRPLYRQLVDELEARLEGELEPGSRLPSEAELAAEFAVNRLTVRQAIAELTRRGLVETIHGRGSFAVGPTVRYPVRAGSGASFSKAMDDLGRNVVVRTLRVVDDDDRHVKRSLATRGTVRRFELVRVVDGTPWSLTTTWLPLRRFPGIEREWTGAGSLYDVLDKHFGIRMQRAARTFAALAAGPVDAEHLMVPIGAPLLVMRGVNVDADDRPVVVVEHRVRGDRVEFTVDL